MDRSRARPSNVARRGYSLCRHVAKCSSLLSGRVLSLKERCEDHFDKWIQDRGPSFVTKNVMDARCIFMETVKDNNFVSHMHSFVCPIYSNSVSE